MDYLLIVANVIFMVAFISLLIFMQRKRLSFSIRVFTGLGLGILFGVILQAIYGTGSDVLKETTDWFSIIGSGYIRLLMMIVIPIVLVSIIQAIINLKTTADVGKMTGWIIGVLIITTMISALVGIGSAALFDLNADELNVGEAEENRGVMLESRLDEIQDLSTPAKILNFIPANIFLDLTGERSTSVIAVVIFSLIVGIAVLGLKRKNPEQAEMFTKIINAIYAVVMRIVTLILRLTPYGILALITTTVANTQLAGIIEIGRAHV